LVIAALIALKERSRKLGDSFFVEVTVIAVEDACIRAAQRRMRMNNPAQRARLALSLVD
jgi:hypothetical protein